MKKNLLIAFFLMVFSPWVYSQAVNDSFTFRNDMSMNYNLHLLRNDTQDSLGKILSVTKLGNSLDSFEVFISQDSTFVQIKSSYNNIQSGLFLYKANYGSLIDSAWVYFNRKNLVSDVYPGDCNKDNLVNHLDLFPIGLMYGTYGDPRNIADTNIVFGVPKKVNNWLVEVRGINAKHADVNGDGIINELDISKFMANYGKSKGTYLPTLSYASDIVKLTLSIEDTFVIAPNTKRVSIPVLIQSPDTISAFGLGFSYTVRVNNPNSPHFSSFYPKTNYLRTNIWDELNTLFVIDTVTTQEHTNIAYCRKNTGNGDMDPQGGVIDIIIDEILLGLANPGDINFMNIYLKEVVLIDNYYNTLPISPVSKRIYFKKQLETPSSIVNSNNNAVNVYPTVIHSAFIIQSFINKEIEYKVYNSLGQEVTTGRFRNEIKISTEDWSDGIYYIKNNLNSEIVKLIKQ